MVRESISPLTRKQKETRDRLGEKSVSISRIFQNTSTKKKTITYISPSRESSKVTRTKPSPTNPNFNYEIEDLTQDSHKEEYSPVVGSHSQDHQRSLTNE